MRAIRTLSSLCFVVPLLVLGACGGGQGGTQTPPTPPPPPPLVAITTLVPGYSVAGNGTLNMSVDGKGFTTSSVVRWNGKALPTTFGTDQILSASVANSLLSLPGTAQITVANGQTTSNALTFGIASPAAATAGVVNVITAAPDGTPANGDSLVAPSISATGRYIAFQSNATNLAPGPASGFQEIYERDTCISAPSACVPTTSRITITFDGSAVNGNAIGTTISSDGRYVTFNSAATNILPNSNDCAPSAGLFCVFMRDTCIGAAAGCIPSTAAISADTNGSIVRGGGGWISANNRYVVFGSNAPNVASGGTIGIGDEYIRDTCIGVPIGCAPSSVLISDSYNGAPRDSFSGPSAVSAAGRFVAFQSWASDIVTNDSVVPGDFWRDTCIGAPQGCAPSTFRVDLTANGSQPNQGIFNGTAPGISGDGRLVAFASQGTNLVSANVGGWGNVYVRDTCTGAPSSCTPSTTLASLANDGSVGNCPSPSQGLSMTANGRFIAFDSIATNLSPDDNFPSCSFEDVFIRDTCFGVASGCTPSTVRVSLTNAPNPQTPGNASSGLPAISGDGHYVVFLSAATNLVPGVTGNGHQMVYLAKTGF